MVSITISGGDRISDITYKGGMSVRQVLEAGYDKYVNPPSMPPLSFWLEFFGTYQGQYLGYIVTMMDGTVQQGSMYWMLYVNNRLASSGIDRTTLKDGDEVQFRYEAYSAELHGNSIMRTVHLLKAGQGS